MAALKVALVSMGRHFFDTAYAQRLHGASASALRSAGMDVHETGETITGDEQAQIVAIRLKGIAPDLIVVQYGTFGLWSHLEKAIGETSCPVVLWVVPEPESPEGRLRLNSMCGANLGANHLYLQHRWFRTFYGAPDDKRVLGAIARIAQAARARRSLRGSRLGVVGEPPAGFYPWQAREDAVCERYGVELVHFPIGRLFELADGASNSEVATARGKLPALQGLDQIEPFETEGSIRISIALNHVADELGLAAAAVRCWPEVPEQRGCAACLGLSELGGRGIPAACEADVYGALTMMALSALGGPVPALMDLVAAEGSNAIFWHCGAAPVSLIGTGARAMVHPNRKVGLGLDFEFGWDTVTAARIGLDREGNDRAVVFGGRRGIMPRHFNGASTAVNVGRPAAELMEELFNLGFEHHYGLSGADLKEPFVELCDMWGISAIGL